MTEDHSRPRRPAAGPPAPTQPRASLFGPGAEADGRNDALSVCVTVTVSERRYAAELEPAAAGNGVSIYALNGSTVVARARGWFAEGVLTATALPHDVRVALQNALADVVGEERSRRVQRQSDMSILLGAASTMGLPAHATPAGEVSFEFLSQLNDALAPADYLLQDRLRDVDFVLWTMEESGEVSAFALATLEKSEQGDRLEIALPDRRREPREVPLRVLLESALILAQRQRVKRVALRAHRDWQRELAAIVFGTEAAQVGPDLCVFGVPS